MKLLIVDDSASFRRRVRTALQRVGVVGALELESADQASPLFDHEGPTVVIIGWGRTAEAVLELVTSTREDLSAPAVLAIVVSPRCLPDDVMRALDSGADDFLIDPFTDRQLAHKVKAAMRRIAV